MLKAEFGHSLVKKVSWCEKGKRHYGGRVRWDDQHHGAVSTDAHRTGLLTRAAVKPQKHKQSMKRMGGHITPRRRGFGTRPPANWSGQISHGRLGVVPSPYVRGGATQMPGHLEPGTCPPLLLPSKEVHTGPRAYSHTQPPTGPS